MARLDEILGFIKEYLSEFKPVYYCLRALFRGRKRIYKSQNYY
jgi:hypothetical protein